MKRNKKWKYLIALIFAFGAFVVGIKIFASQNMSTINGGPIKLIYDYIGHYELNYTGNTNNYDYWNESGTSKLVNKIYRDRLDIAGNNSSATIRKTDNSSKIVKVYLIWETRSERGVTESITFITPNNYGIQIPAQLACKDIRTNKTGQEYTAVYTMATDVTSIVCGSNGGYGTYTVANIPVWEGAGSGVACGGESVASWQLVVVEESPNFPLRTISLNMMSQYFFNVDYSVKVDFADASAPNGVVTASFLYGMVDLYGDMVYDGIGYEDDHEYVYNGKYFRYFTSTRGLYKNGVCINDRDSGDAYGIASNAKGGIRLHMFDDKRRSNSAGSDKLTYYLAGKNAGINTFLYGAAIDIFAYDVIFDGNGADSGSMANMSCVYGRGYFLPENKFSKQYYEFAGWNTKADGSGDSYWSGSFVSNLTSTDKSVTLYAQWKPKGYLISLDHQNATTYGTANYYEWYGFGNYAEATCVNKIDKITVPTKIGSTFGGYYSGLNGTGTQYISPDGTITAESTTFTKDTTLYAKWTPRVCKITLDNQGATSAGTKQYFQKYNVGNYTTSDCTVAISKIANPSKTHYTFQGYYTDTNGTGQRIIDSGGNISKIYSLFDSDTTLYAYWEPVTYTINLDNQDPTTMGDKKFYEKYGVANYSEIKNVTALIGSKTVTFDYTGGLQGFEAPFDGTYTLTAYGADGEGRSSGAGKTFGIVYLKKGERLWINVGGAGNGTIGGYNGGGNGGVVHSSTYTFTSQGGGGATDFRRDGYAIDNRIMVAGGSGGAVNCSSGRVFLGGSAYDGEGDWGSIVHTAYPDKTIGIGLGDTYPIQNTPPRQNQGETVSASLGNDYLVTLSLLHKGSLGQGATGAGGGYYGGGHLHITMSGTYFTNGIYVVGPGAGSGYIGGVNNGVLYGVYYSNSKYYYYDNVNRVVSDLEPTGKNHGKALITYNDYNTTTELKEARSVTIPTKKGYRFNGYWTEKNGTGTQYVDASGNILSTPTTFTKDTTLYAHWIADGSNVYRIAFNGNGATSGKMSIMTCAFNTNYTLYGNGFSKEGYTFNGWNTKPDGSGTSYVNKATVNNLASRSGDTVTLYAQWNIGDSPYNVHHYVEGMDGNDKWVLHSIDGHWGTSYSSINPRDFIKSYTGYSYSHAEVKGSTVENAVIQPDGSLVLTLYYTRNSYTVTLNKDDGIENVSGAGTYKYGSVVNIKANPVKGYTWNGWIGTYNSSSKIYTFSMPDGNVAMTATTSPTIFKISLDHQGANEYGTTEYYQKYGVGNYEDRKCTTALSKIMIPQKTGYIFGGYYEQMNGGGTQYIDTDGIIKASASEFKEDTTLYAKWIPITYIIRFEGNGATGGSMDDFTCTYGTLHTLPENAFTRTHYVFNSWNTKADGSGDTYVTGSAVENLTIVQNEVITLYAQWTANKYYIHFDANGGEGYMSDIEMTYDSPQRLPLNAFTKNNGYGDSIFLGWNILPDTREVLYTDGAEVVDVAETDASTLILYAVWDDCPWIHAVDQYYSLEDAVSGRITQDELLSRAMASDREDGENISGGVNPDTGTSFTVMDYQPSDFTIFISDGSVTETYQVVDSVGNVYKQTITVYVVDTKPKEIKPDETTRFINEKYYNETYVNGGLTDSSIWKTDTEYIELITNAFENSKNDTPVMSYLFEYKDIVQMKQFVKENGIGNMVHDDALERFYKLYMEPKMLNYH